MAAVELDEKSRAPSSRYCALQVMMWFSSLMPCQKRHIVEVEIRTIQRNCEGSKVKRKKWHRFEKAGWKVGTTEEFLGLSAEEVRYIELKLALSDAVRRQRSNAGLSQEELAKRL
ncbi:MAG TPA: hypothetical protein VJ837_01710, partial [Candidatus Paceibacterota bacterium]|nr:hypothetical protein [Candidatus Paceibacterota bacterium]